MEQRVLLTSLEVIEIIETSLGDSKPNGLQTIIENLLTDSGETIAEIRLQWRLNKDQGVMIPFYIDLPFSELTKDIIENIGALMKERIDKKAY